MSTGSLGLEGAFFLRGILDHSLYLFITDLSSLLKSTTSRGTKLSGLLGTSSDGGVLLHVLLGDAADLSGPFGALGEGGVPGGLVLALLILDGLTLNNIILNIMFLLLGPTLGFILGSTDLRSLDITVLDQGLPAHLNSLIDSILLIVDEAVLSEVLLALLLLLGLIVGNVGGVAPSVVGVVTLDSLIVLSLLDHLNLVNTSLSIRSRTCSSNSREAHVSPLTVSSGIKILRCNSSRFLMMSMMVMMVVIGISSIKWEGIQQ